MLKNLYEKLIPLDLQNSEAPFGFEHNGGSLHDHRDRVRQKVVLQ